MSGWSDDADDYPDNDPIYLCCGPGDCDICDGIDDDDD